MANLKNLDAYCKHGFLDMRMRFDGWAGPYMPRYKCPWCGHTKIFKRDNFGGRIRCIKR